MATTGRLPDSAHLNKCQLLHRGNRQQQTPCDSPSQACLTGRACTSGGLAAVRAHRVERFWELRHGINRHVTVARQDVR